MTDEIKPSERATDILLEYNCASLRKNLEQMSPDILRFAVAKVIADETQCDTLAEQNKELVKALDRLYQSVDSCMELTPTVLQHAKSILAKHTTQPKAK